MAGKIPPEDKTFYVAADGTGDYYSIQRALDMAPKTGGAVLSVSPGVYREVLTVDKPNITIRSVNSDASKTVIVNDRSAGQNGGTLHSATVNVTADNFFAENITIRKRLQQDASADCPQGSQALAILVTGDRASLSQCAPPRQSGHGLSRHAMRPATRKTAPSRANTSPIVTSPAMWTSSSATPRPSSRTARFTPRRTPAASLPRNRSTIPPRIPASSSTTAKLTADPGVAGQVFLGRPWRPYATVIFMHTAMDDKIDPAGWREWHPGETHFARHRLLRRVRLHRPRRASRQRDPHTHFLTPDEAKQYEPSIFLRGADNWDPSNFRCLPRNKIDLECESQRIENELKANS